MKNKGLARVTIDISRNIHYKFKALATSRGKSIEEMVVDYMHEQTVEECPYSHIPNEKTLTAIENIEKGKGLTVYKDLEDFLNTLGI